MKRNKKTCGRLEVYNLVKESIEFGIFPDNFTKKLNSLIENESVIVNTFRNRECISLRKGTFQEIETEKEDIREQLHQFKNDFSDEFNEFKTKFLRNANYLKILFLILHQKTQETRNI